MTHLLLHSQHKLQKIQYWYCNNVPVTAQPANAIRCVQSCSSERRLRSHGRSTLPYRTLYSFLLLPGRLSLSLDQYSSPFIYVCEYSPTLYKQYSITYLPVQSSQTSTAMKISCFTHSTCIFFALFRAPYPNICLNTRISLPLKTCVELYTLDESIFTNFAQATENCHRI